MTVDNSRTEEQHTEAFRQEVMQQLARQTKAAEMTRHLVGWLLGIVVALIALQIVFGANL